MKKILSLPVQLLLVLAGAVCLGSFLPLPLSRGIYTASFLIKELLEFALPFVVFFFISSGIMAFKKNSLAMVGLLLGIVFASNYLTALYTYCFGSMIVDGLAFNTSSLVHLGSNMMQPLFSLGIMPLCGSEKAMLAALFTGIGLSFVSFPQLTKVIAQGKQSIEWGLANLFIPVLPLYVLGFFLKMTVEMPLLKLFSVYGLIFAAAVGMQVVYLMGTYFLVAGMRVQRAIKLFMTALPSYVTALGTMSSIAALPVSVVTAEQNSGNKALAQFAMPILANIHLMGDAVSVPLFCLATMKVFTGTLPLFSTYLLFITYFCLTMLAVSGIPGGGIIVMLPLLKSLFHFSPEMLSLMTALYLLQDAFGTAANVMGDGALVVFINTISIKLGLQPQRKGMKS